MFNRTNLILLAVVVIAAFVGYLQLSSSPEDGEGNGGGVVSSRRTVIADGAKPGKLLTRLRGRVADEKGQKVEAQLPAGVHIVKPDEMTEEMRKFIASLAVNCKGLVEMRAALDRRDYETAFAMARALMKHPERRMRLAALQTFGWIGSAALPEISEMLTTAIAEGAEQEVMSAMDAWKQAFAELTDPAEKAQLIVDMIGQMKTRGQVNWLVMEFPMIDANYSIAALSDIIETYDGRLQAECSRMIYPVVAGSSYVSPEKAAEQIEEYERNHRPSEPGETKTIVLVDPEVEAMKGELLSPAGTYPEIRAPLPAQDAPPQ